MRSGTPAPATVAFKTNYARADSTFRRCCHASADPRRHNYEYAKWEQYKRAAAKAQMWEKGYWEIPYASEMECQEQAVRMADHFSRLFQRSVRAFDNHRLAKGKVRRLFVPAARR